jgi:hypothetical protein
MKKRVIFKKLFFEEDELKWQLDETVIKVVQTNLTTSETCTFKIIFIFEKTLSHTLSPSPISKMENWILSQFFFLLDERSGHQTINHTCLSSKTSILCHFEIGKQNFFVCSRKFYIKRKNSTFIIDE